MLRSLAGEDKGDNDKDKADNEDDNDNDNYNDNDKGDEGDNDDKDGDGNIRYSNVNIAQPKYRPFNDFQPHNKSTKTKNRYNFRSNTHLTIFSGKRIATRLRRIGSKLQSLSSTDILIGVGITNIKMIFLICVGISIVC